MATGEVERLSRELDELRLSYFIAQGQVGRLVCALRDAVNSPQGHVPDSAIDFMPLLRAPLDRSSDAL